MDYFQMSLCRILVVIILLITVFSCASKSDTISNIDDLFEKTVSIPLEEIEEMPVFVFTDFGFYTSETSLCRISKYNNKGEFELSFGQKGKGPGEIELGLPVSYSEDDNRLGIFDVGSFKISYFDGNGNFLDYGVIKVFGQPRFQLSKNGITVSTFTQFPSNSTQKIYTDVITINNEKILEKETKMIDYVLVDFYLYSINKNKVYIIERTENNFDVFSYNTQNMELQKVALDKSQIRLKAGGRLTSFFSIDDYLILSDSGISEESGHFFFDLKGNYLGTVDLAKDLQAIMGVYNDYLYIYRTDEQDNYYIDIYSAK